MRKKFYHFNREEIRKNHNRKMRKNAAKLVCVVTLSATVLSSIPYTANASAYAGAVQNTVSMRSAVSTENAVVYDLSDSSLITEKVIYDYKEVEQTFHIIDINITTDGTYIIKGSNYINGAYIDTHIAVAEGVEANIIFDGADIKNDDTYCNEVDYCAGDIYSYLFPLMDIAGTANIYTKKDSVLEDGSSYGTAISVSGTLRIRDTDENGTLRVKSFMPVAAKYTGRGQMYIEGGSLRINCAISQSGKQLDEVVMTGGNLLVDNNRAINADHVVISGGKIQGTSDTSNISAIGAEKSIKVTGGQIDYRGENIREGRSALFRCDNIRVTGGSYNVDNIAEGWCGNNYGQTYDFSGRPTYLYTLTGLPADTAITRINGRVVTDTMTSEDGTIKTFLPSRDNVIETEDQVYTYKYDEDTKKMELSTDLKTHQVTFKLGNEIYDTITVLHETGLGGVLDDEQYTYSYQTETGEEWGGSDDITEDMTLVLNRTPQECHVEMEGKGSYVAYGTVLEEGYLYCEDHYSYRLHYPGEKITEDLKLIRIPAVKENGEWCVLIKSQEDAVKLRDFINGKNDLNVRLETDLNFGASEESWIMTYDSYYGVFDGNGHRIENLTRDRYETQSAITPHLYGTVKNVCFSMIHLNDPDGTEQGSGAICGRNYGTIENCIVIGIHIDSTAESSDSFKTDKGFIAGWNMGTIRDCYTSGNFNEGDGEVYPVTRNMRGTIENTYYESETETEDGGRTWEQFIQGDVCWELNKGVTDGTQKWYQNLDESDDQDYIPDLIPSLDASHGVVRETYKGCRGGYYTNKESVKPVHDMEYTSQGDTLTAACKSDASHKVSATVKAEKDIIQYDGKPHEAKINYVYSDEWIGDKDISYDIIYTRDGEVTKDLTSEGIIKASIASGGAVAAVEYTIGSVEVPSESPVVSPKASDTPMVSDIPVESQSPSPDHTRKPESSEIPGQTEAPEQSGKPVTSQEPSPEGSKQPSVPSKAPLPEGSKSPASSEAPSPVVSQLPASSGEPVPGKNPSASPAGSKHTKSKKAGDKIKDKKGNEYKITGTAKNKKTVTFLKVSAKAKKTITIPETISVEGVTYKVTEIASQAFAGNKKITRAVIGTNVESIGKKAFYNCKKLHKIVIKSKKLKASRIGKNAFAKLNAKAVITVPADKMQSYKKWLKKKGITGKQKIINS